jgi:hypothetical protein
MNLIHDRPTAPARTRPQSTPGWPTKIAHPCIDRVRYNFSAEAETSSSSEALGVKAMPRIETVLRDGTPGRHQNIHRHTKSSLDIHI